MLTALSSSLRQCVVYHCLHQLWCTLPAYTDTLLSSIPPSASCDEEILAAAVALATRFLSSSSSSTRQKKMRSAPIPIEPTTCPTCGPYRPHPPAHTSDAASVSTVGYISISPSPSELALPNVVFNSSQFLDDTDFLPLEELFQKIPFGSVVAVREALLPLLQAAGLPVQPQLRTLCHNKHRLLVDFSAHLKEGLVFVLDHRALLSQNVPIICVKQATVSGSLQTCSERSTSHSPPLSILLGDGSGSEEGACSSVTSVTGQFSAQASSVDVAITVPLMKLTRHLIETFKVRASQGQRFPSQAASKKAATFSLRVSGSLEGVDGDWKQSLPASMDIWGFTRTLVTQLSLLERRGREPSGTLQAGIEASSITVPSLSHHSPTSSNIRVPMEDYSHSPLFHHNVLGVSLDQHTPQNHHSPPEPSSLPPSNLQPDTSLTAADVAIQIEGVDRPVSLYLGAHEDQISPLDTSGADVASSDDFQLSSSSPKMVPSQTTSPTPKPDPASLPPRWLADAIPLQRTLDTPSSSLSYSLFGLLRLDSLSFHLHVETTTTTLRLDGQLPGNTLCLLPLYTCISYCVVGYFGWYKFSRKKQKTFF